MIQYKQLIITIIVSFLITLVLGPIVIPLLQRLKVGQSIREDGPRSHMIKSGTPTRGLIAIAAMLSKFDSRDYDKDLYVAICGSWI